MGSTAETLLALKLMLEPLLQLEELLLPRELLMPSEMPVLEDPAEVLNDNDFLDAICFLG